MDDPYDQLDLSTLGRRTSIKWQRYGPDVLPLWVAEMDFPLAEPISRALHGLVDASDTGYATGNRLVEAFARFAASRYGWQVDPAMAWPFSDVMTAVEYVLSRLTEPGDPVAFLTPAYPPFFVSVEGLRRPVAGVPMAFEQSGRAVIDLDALDLALREGARAILLCNPQNPTGRRFTEEELLGVAALADRHGAPVVSDEIHAPLVLEPSTAPHVPFATLDAEAAAHGVCVHSASKGWNVPGLKAAVLVAGSGAIADRLRGEVLEEQSERTGIAGVAAGIAAFDEGEPWLDDTVAYIARNQRLVLDSIATALPGARVAAAEATYLAWLDLRAVAGLGDREPAEILLQRSKVALVPGPLFGERYRGWARMNVGTSRPILQEALTRLAGAVSA